MYIITRIIIFIIFVMLFFWLNNKRKMTPKARIVYAIICFITIILCSAYPFENAVYTFSSPEAAYRYKYSEIDLVIINGRNSTLTIPKEDIENCPRDIFPRNDKGWELPYLSNYTPIFDAFYGDELIKIRECRGDHYVFVSSHNITEISDNKGSDFWCEKNQLSDGINSFYAYAYVEDITDYVISLNKTPIVINKTQ